MGHAGGHDHDFAGRYGCANIAALNAQNAFHDVVILGFDGVDVQRGRDVFAISARDVVEGELTLGLLCGEQQGHDIAQDDVAFEALKIGDRLMGPGVGQTCNQAASSHKLPILTPVWRRQRGSAAYYNFAAFL